jgi:hypothetical protein
VVRDAVVAADVERTTGAIAERSLGATAERSPGAAATTMLFLSMGMKADEEDFC